MIRSLRFRVVLAAAVLGTTLVGAALADNMDRRIRLINRSHQTISEFYASNVGATGWEEDILGSSVLPPGQSVVINLNDGTGYCRFDFKTVTEEGTAIHRRGINVCETSTYTITD